MATMALWAGIAAAATAAAAAAAALLSVAELQLLRVPPCLGREE